MIHEEEVFLVESICSSQNSLENVLCSLGKDQKTSENLVYFKMGKTWYMKTTSPVACIFDLTSLERSALFLEMTGCSFEGSVLYITLIGSTGSAAHL